MEQTSYLDFFRWLYSSCELGNVNFRFLDGNLQRNEFVPLSAIYDDPSLLDAVRRDYPKFNHYFGVALREGHDGTKAGVVQVPALWTDLDGSPLEPVLQSQFPPSAIIETRPGRFHVYWKLREPENQSGIARVENLLRRLCAHFHGDTNATDASRILRIPGSENFKVKPAYRVSIKLMNGAEYNLSDFDDLPELEDPGPASQVSGGNGTGDRLKKIMQCLFLQHCDKDRATLPEPEWYGMVSILARESGGRELFHSLSRGYAKYSRKETDEKILHSLGAGPLTCQKNQIPL